MFVLPTWRCSLIGLGWYERTNERTRGNIIDREEPDLGTIPRVYHCLLLCEQTNHHREKETAAGVCQEDAIFSLHTNKQTQQQRAAPDNFSVVEVKSID